MSFIIRSTKSAFFCICLLGIASCAPKGFVELPAGDLENSMLADLGSNQREPVSYVDIAPDDFVITEAPARLKKYKDLEVSLSVSDLSFTQVITLLFNEYGVDHFIADSGAGKGGKVSLNYNGPLQNLLDTLAMHYGYYFAEENGVIRISDDRVYVFSIPPMVSELLSSEASSSTNSSSSTGSRSAQATGASSPSAVSVTSEQSGDFLATLKNMGAKDTVIDQMNSLVSFKCNSSSLAGIRAYLKKLRENVAIISLDVLVAEVELSNEFSRGIDWGLFYDSSDGGGGFSLPLGLDVEMKPGILGFGLIDGEHWDIGSILSFLETQGETEILQKPTITVLNGHRAFLRAGREIPYVDEISITPTQVGTTLTFLQEVTFKTILEGIEIEILPRVREDLITLSLRGLITGIIDFVERDIGEGSVAKPVSTTRDVQTVTAMKAGEILKIGGIIVGVDRKNSKGIPGSDATAVTDFMLSQRADSNLRNEIVILVKPQIIRFRENKG